MTFPGNSLLWQNPILKTQNSKNGLRFIWWRRSQTLMMANRPKTTKGIIKEENLRKKLNKTHILQIRIFLRLLKNITDCSGSLKHDRLTMIFTDQTDINNVILC